MLNTPFSPWPSFTAEEADAVQRGLPHLGRRLGGGDHDLPAPGRAAHRAADPISVPVGRHRPDVAVDGGPALPGRHPSQAPVGRRRAVRPGGDDQAAGDHPPSLR